MKKILLAALLAASAGVLSCNGNYDADPNTNNSSTNNPLNTNNGGGGNNSIIGKWKANAGILIIGTDTTDVYAAMDDCEKDNISSFNSDHTYVVDEGTLKCTPEDPTAFNGTWSLSGNNLTVITPSNTQKWEILQLDNTTLKITYTGSINGSSATVIQTYTRQ